MFVIFRTESGKLAVRPAYIGFIKNNFLRRTLCALFYPVTIMATILMNLTAVFINLVVVIFSTFIYSTAAAVKAFWFPIKGIRPIWKSEIWERPRTKSDNGRMH